MAAWLEPYDKAARCRRWRLHWSSGSGHSRVHRTRIFDGLKREATIALADFAKECESQTTIAATFKTFANDWNDSRLKAGTIAPETHEKYYWHIHALAPVLPVYIHEITPAAILSAYSVLKANKVDGGRAWSNTTLLTAHNSLTRIFRAAVAEGLIAHSPMDDVDAPTNDTPAKRALMPSEARLLLDSLDYTDNRQFAVSLILRCGLRRGETCALQWQDVDDCIHIKRHATKTAAGVRSIPLDNETKELIEQRRGYVNATLESVGDCLSPTDRLCCSVDGRPMTRESLKRWWQRHRQDYGLDDWTLHELRHTYLTNLAQAGVHPAIMQRLAGHASMSTTLKIYTHVNNDDLRQAAQKLQNLRQSAPKNAPRFTS